jgi:hypothetical protein
MVMSFIDSHREELGIEPICRELAIAPSSYHEHATRLADPGKRSARARRDDEIKPQIRRVHEDSSGLYGARKVWHQMRREGAAVAKCTVERLMRAMGLAGVCAETCARAGLGQDALTVKADAHDRQTLLLDYPSVTPTDAYIAKSVKIESGAKSALDPNSVRTITPYVDTDVPGIDLAVQGITVVDAERTFWDKVVILHGLRRWYDIRGLLRGNGQRISRHYYDLFRLLQSDSGKAAIKDAALGADCVAHARMFFNRPDFDLASAQPPTFALCPDGAMMDDLRQDYRAMSVMIFGEPPAFDAVIEAIAALEAELNAQGAQR